MRYELPNEGEGVFLHADVLDDLIVVSSHVDTQFCVHLFRVVQDAAPTCLKSYKIEGEITCLSACRQNGNACVTAGVWFEGTPWLHLYYPSDNPNADTDLYNLKLLPGMLRSHPVLRIGL